MALKEILISCDNYYPISGGIQQYVRGLGLELSKRGYKIYILTSSVEGQPEREHMPEGHVIRTPLLSDAIPHPERLLSKWKQLVPLIGKIKPDLIFANNHSSVAIIKAAQSLDLPVIHCCRGWGLLCPLKIRLLKPEKEELCLNERSFENCSVCARRTGRLYTSTEIREQAKKELLRETHISLKRKMQLLFNSVSPIPLPRLKTIISPSDDPARNLKTLVDRYDQYQKILDSADRIVSLSKKYSSFFDFKKTKVIPVGIDTNFYYPVEEDSFLEQLEIKEPYILVTSRIHHIKGQSWAVKALKYLPSEIKLVLAGNTRLFSGARYEDNIHTREVRDTIKRLNLKDRVIFTGLIMPNKLRQLYSGAVATIVPSIWAEPYGQVTIEAMACACPVIITENSGSAEAVDSDVNGYIVLRKNSKAIADAVKMIHEERDEFGQNAREKVMKEYAWPILSKRIIELFREVLSNRS